MESESVIPWDLCLNLVGARGFEPPASASRTQRSSQTEPRPDMINEKSDFNITRIRSPANWSFKCFSDFHGFEDLWMRRRVA